MTFYMVLHRCVKWWKKLFFYLLEVCFCNSLVIWRAITNKRINAEIFRLKIVHGMLQNYRKATPNRGGRQVRDRPDRIIGRDHFIGVNQTLLPNGKRSKPDCVVCSDRKHKRHQTQYICKKCDRAMCTYPCFERWHSLVDYKVLCTQDLHQ